MFDNTGHPLVKWSSGQYNYCLYDVILKFISKLIECTVSTQLLDHLSANNALDQCNQHIVQVIA